MPSRRAVVALLVVGVVLLPGPGYAVAFDELNGPERTRSPSGYVATPIDASNDTVVAEQYAASLAFQPANLEHRYLAEQYRRPNETKEVLLTAIAEGAATTSDSEVVADLREVVGRHHLLTNRWETYYVVSVTRSGDETTVFAREANATTIAEIARDEYLVRYEELSASKRATFEKIRNATRSEEEYGYRPWNTENAPEPPLMVERNGTTYAVSTGVHVDDFGPSIYVFVGLAASALGVICLVGSGLLALYLRITG